MDNDIKTQVLEIVCEMCGKEKTKTLEYIWKTGLEDVQCDKLKLAIKYYCKHAEDRFMPTPAKFMSYLKHDDPHGNKAAQKKIDETRKMLNEDYA